MASLFWSPHHPLVGAKFVLSDQVRILIVGLGAGYTSDTNFLSNEIILVGTAEHAGEYGTVNEVVTQPLK